MVYCEYSISTNQMAISNMGLFYITVEKKNPRLKYAAYVGQGPGSQKVLSCFWETQYKFREV